MTIDEAIKHCEEVAEANERTCKAKPNVNLEKYIECAAEHRQLAEWLKELKQHREAWQKVYEEFDKDKYNFDSEDDYARARLIIDKALGKVGEQGG